MRRPYPDHSVETALRKGAEDLAGYWQSACSRSHYTHLAWFFKPESIDQSGSFQGFSLIKSPSRASLAQRNYVIHSHTIFS